MPVHGYMNYNRVGPGGRLVQVLEARRRRFIVSAAKGGGKHKTCLYPRGTYFRRTIGGEKLRHSFGRTVPRRMCRQLRGRVSRVN